MREEYLARPAREALERASDEDRVAFEQIIRQLCSDPDVEWPVKTQFDASPAVILLYNDRRYWMAYDLPDDATLRIWMIGKAPDEPQPR